MMTKRSWQELCEAIMQEQDPQTLLSLVEELNRALDHRETELKHSHPEFLPQE
jgi:hypothetical protein